MSECAHVCFAGVEMRTKIEALEAENLNLRRRIHNVERHNQHFERCESSFCNPSDCPTELSKLPQGDLAKLETINKLEVENAELRKENLSLVEMLRREGLRITAAIDILDGTVMIDAYKTNKAPSSGA